VRIIDQHEFLTGLVLFFYFIAPGKRGISMDFFMKLPRNKKEFALFLAIISVISVNIIAPLITFFEIGFSITIWKNVLEVIPFIWLSVICLVLLTYNIADKLTKRIVDDSDSFNAHVIINTLCSVFIMSLFLTIIGSWIGNKSISLDPIKFFFYKWPRNFTISFFIELLIAQPFARFVMLKLHQLQEKKG